MEQVAFEIRDGVAWIALDRPERLNAISRPMMTALHAAMDRAEADDRVAAVVVHGRGRAFSAGMDLKDDAAARVEGPEGWRRVLGENLALVMRFWDSPRLTVAAVHGHCVAAACDLAMACDITVAETGTVFGKPELQFGSTVTAMLMPHIAGPKIAKEILLTGEDGIRAEQALALGLVNRVVGAGEAVAEAGRIAARAAGMDETAVRLTKRAINAAVDAAGLRAALELNLELAVEIETAETPSRRAFKEKVQTEGLKAALAWRAAIPLFVPRIFGG